MSTLCTVERTVRGLPVTDGAGVRLTRIIGSPRLDHADPFVLLDEFRSEDPRDYIAGFPDHPHRGIETITYMVEGRFRHRDSRGGGGILGPGDVQWMTAGRGIVHSEMPEMNGGRLWGYQLWLNLARRDKMVAPRYQQLDARDIPTTEKAGARVKVIAGEFDGARGPAQTWYPVSYFDVQLSAGGEFRRARPEGVCLLFVHSGQLVVGDSPAPLGRGELLFLSAGSEVRAANASSKDQSGFLLIAGTPHHEPIARGGPFVMNTAEEIRQAFLDYQSGRLF